jgi:hypothetical protein
MQKVLIDLSVWRAEVVEVLAIFISCKKSSDGATNSKIEKKKRLDDAYCPDWSQILRKTNHLLQNIMKLGQKSVL